MGGMKSAITGDKISLLDGTIFHSFKSNVTMDIKAMLIAMLGYAPDGRDRGGCQQD